MHILESVRLQKKQSNQIQIYGAILSVLAAFIFSYAYVMITGVSMDVQFNVALLVAVIVSLPVAVLLHELIHGLVFVLAGGKMRMGVGMAGYMPVAWCSTDGSRISVRAMMVAAYAPFLVLSALLLLLTVLFPEYYLFFCMGFIVNFGGAAGDLWLSTRLKRYMNVPGVTVEAKAGGGLDVYGKKSTKKPQEVTRKPAKLATRTGMVFIGAGLVMYVMQTVVALTIHSLTSMPSYELGVGGLYLIKYVIEDGELYDESSVSAGILLAACVALVYLVVAGLRQRKRP